MLEFVAISIKLIIVYEMYCLLLPLVYYFILRNLFSLLFLSSLILHYSK